MTRLGRAWKPPSHERVSVNELRVRRGRSVTQASPVLTTIDGVRDMAADRAAYSAYLGSETWRLRRARLIKATCEKCGRGGDLVLHHKTYEHVGHERPWELATLCPGCHSKLHAFARRHPEWSLERASYRFLDSE